MIQDEAGRFGRVYDLVAKGMEEMQIPGGILGILHGGQEKVAGLGITNIENPLPVTPITLFQAGSITKTFTATAVMRLVEMNQIELDEPVLTYLPGLRIADREAARKVSMRHLLTHTCGWLGDHFEDFGRGEDALAKATQRLADLPQITPLGEVWSYNNSAFFLAGRIIEVITGKSYEQAIQELILDALGLEHSYFFAEDVITHRFMVGHQKGEQGHQVARPWSIGRAMHPVGGLSSTIPDLLRYARFHMGNGKNEEGRHVLTPESLQQMQTPIIPATGLEWMGLAWFIIKVGTERILEHPGGTNGQVSTLLLVPEKEFALVLMFNSDLGRRLIERIKHKIVEDYTGLQVPEAIPMDMDIERLKEYTGRYTTTGQMADLKTTGNKLELNITLTGGFPTPDAPPRPSPPAALMGFYEEDRVVVLNAPFKGERAEFVRDRSGQVKWMRLLGRLHVKA
jgi:CubicO group peptidase (beta-lactamase class C family)